MTAEERRLAVREKYKVMIGRNKYSQARRGYYWKAYSDGYYYSDCSSSTSGAYIQAGEGFGLLNTVGMYNSKKMTDVDVVIKNGQIQNPEVLRIGDLLLYAGSDSSRASSGYVGHVEMLGEINNGKYVLYGHGSGNPKKTEMVSKNKSRYNSKTSTKLGHKGLIRVRRVIQDDTVEEPETPDVLPVEDGLKVKSGTWNIRSAPYTSSEVLGTVSGGTVVEPVTADGWHFIRTGDLWGWVSDKALEV